MKKNVTILEKSRTRKSNWLTMLACVTLMNGCASVLPLTLPNNVYDCPEPEAYPENPTLNDLVYALNDTYLAWEACHYAFQHKI